MLSVLSILRVPCCCSQGYDLEEKKKSSNAEQEQNLISSIQEIVVHGHGRVTEFIESLKVVIIPPPWKDDCMSGHIKGIFAGPHRPIITIRILLGGNGI